MDCNLQGKSERWFPFLWLLVMLIIFSCAYWPSVYLLWKNVCSDYLLFFLSCIVHVFDFELYELLIYFEYYPFIWYMICKYFLPFGRLPFHFVNGFLCCALVWCSPSCLLLLLLPLLSVSNLKNSLPRLMVRNLLLVFSSRHFQSFKSTLQKEKCKPIFSKLLITNFSLPYLGYKKRSFSVVYLWWFGGLVAKSCPTLATPWTVTCQPPLPMGFSRQEYCSGLPFPSSGDLPNSGIEPGSPALQADSLPTELWGKPSFFF